MGAHCRVFSFSPAASGFFFVIQYSIRSSSKTSTILHHEGSVGWVLEAIFSSPLLSLKMITIVQSSIVPYAQSYRNMLRHTVCGCVRACVRACIVCVRRVRVCVNTACAVQSGKKYFTRTHTHPDTHMHACTQTHVLEIIWRVGASTYCTHTRPQKRTLSS